MQCLGIEYVQMPVEEIRRIQQERADQAARDRASREAAEKRATQEREDQERQKREVEQKRRTFVSQQTERILNQSGTIHGLQRIQKEMLEGNVDNNILSYSPENAKATLAWGKGIEDSGDGLVKSRGSDYSAIYIRVDVDKEILTIQGSQTFQLDKNKWRDVKSVEKTLAHAYVDPYRYFQPTSESHSSSSDDSGCCCSSGGM